MFAEKVQNFAKIRNFSPCGHTEFGLFCLTSTHISHFKRQLLKTVFDFDSVIIGSDRKPFQQFLA